LAQDTLRRAEQQSAAAAAAATAAEAAVLLQQKQQQQITTAGAVNSAALRINSLESELAAVGQKVVGLEDSLEQRVAEQHAEAHEQMLEEAVSVMTPPPRKSSPCSPPPRPAQAWPSCGRYILVVAQARRDAADRAAQLRLEAAEQVSWSALLN
jgi:hypothetical protein